MVKEKLAGKTAGSDNEGGGLDAVAQQTESIKAVAEGTVGADINMADVTPAVSSEEALVAREAAVSAREEAMAAREEAMVAREEAMAASKEADAAADDVAVVTSEAEAAHTPLAADDPTAAESTPAAADANAGADAIPNARDDDTRRFVAPDGNVFEWSESKGGWELIKNNTRSNNRDNSTDQIRSFVHAVCAKHKIGARGLDLVGHSFGTSCVANCMKGERSRAFVNHVTMIVPVSFAMQSQLVVVLKEQLQANATTLDGLADPDDHALHRRRVVGRVGSLTGVASQYGRARSDTALLHGVDNVADLLVVDEIVFPDTLAGLAHSEF